MSKETEDPVPAADNTPSELKQGDAHNDASEVVETKDSGPPPAADLARELAECRAKIAELEAANKSAANGAIERCAKVLEVMTFDELEDYAVAIRALKG